MTNWINEIDISEAWNDATCNKITIQQLSKEIANKLSNLNYTNLIIEEEKKNLIKIFTELSTISEDEEIDVNVFDHFMYKLYDWADQSLSLNEKVCWIIT